MTGRRIMPEPIRLKSTEAIYDLTWAVVTMVVQSVLSVPLALAILVALALCILPGAVGWHQGWAHIISELNRTGAPRELFAITKRLFEASWIFAFFAKLLVLQDEQNLVVQQRLVREKAREKRRNEAVAAVK